MLSKIAFVNPPFMKGFSRSQRSPAVTKSGTLYYPYWLAYGAGWAQKKGFEVGLFDFVASAADYKKAASELKNFSPDLIVVDSSTPSIAGDLAFVKKLKTVLPKSFVCIVGTHVSAMPARIIKSEGVDFVAVGEYDQTIVDLASAIEKGKPFDLVAGLVMRKGKRVITTKPRSLLKNLDDFPFVSQIYSCFLNIDDYYFSAADHPMVMIMTGRGCPFGCFFCVYPQLMFGRQYRMRSPRNIADEFAYIEKSLPRVKEVVIDDDTFTVDEERVRSFCQLLLNQKNKLKWSTNARATLSLKTMRAMKKAGCRLLIVGYESGSQEVLEKMGKKITIADSLLFARNARRAGLLVHGCFMVGNPGETKKTMEKTLQFAKTLLPDSAQFYPLFVYPGTRAYDWAKDSGYLRTEDYRQWLDGLGQHRCVVDLPDLSAREMMDFCRRAFVSYHLSPRYLFYKLFQMFRDPAEGVRSLRGGFNLIKSYV